MKWQHYINIFRNRSPIQRFSIIDSFPIDRESNVLYMLTKHHGQNCSICIEKYMLERAFETADI